MEPNRERVRMDQESEQESDQESEQEYSKWLQGQAEAVVQRHQVREVTETQAQAEESAAEEFIDASRNLAYARLRVIAAQIELNQAEKDYSVKDVARSQALASYRAAREGDV